MEGRGHACLEQEAAHMAQYIEVLRAIDEASRVILPRQTRRTSSEPYETRKHLALRDRVEERRDPIFTDKTEAFQHARARTGDKRSREATNVRDRAERLKAMASERGRDRGALSLVPFDARALTIGYWLGSIEAFVPPDVGDANKKCCLCREEPRTWATEARRCAICRDTFCWKCARAKTDIVPLSHGDPSETIRTCVGCKAIYDFVLRNEQFHRSISRGGDSDDRHFVLCYQRLGFIASEVDSAINEGDNESANAYLNQLRRALLTFKAERTRYPRLHKAVCLRFCRSIEEKAHCLRMADMGRMERESVDVAMPRRIAIPRVCRRPVRMHLPQGPAGPANASGDRKGFLDPSGSDDGSGHSGGRLGGKERGDAHIAIDGSYLVPSSPLTETTDLPRTAAVDHHASKHYGGEGRRRGTPAW